MVLWGLPDRARRSTGRGLSRLLHRNSRFRHALYKLTGPGLIWMITIGLLIVWHDPNLYNAALRYEWLHDLEHLSFFLPAVALMISCPYFRIITPITIFIICFSSVEGSGILVS